MVIPRSVDNGGMIEIRIRYHQRHLNKVVKPRPIIKARQMCAQTRLGLRSPIVEHKNRFHAQILVIIRGLSLLLSGGG